MEKVDWKVEGMSCTNCALSIADYLKKEGVKKEKQSVFEKVCLPARKFLIAPHPSPAAYLRLLEATL